MPNPVRIYVLHHPESELGAALADRIYDWFRLPSLEGIPVYIRSVAAGPDGRPLDPAGDPKSNSALEYLIPLVDAQMVRDPVWHDYLVALAEGCASRGSTASCTAGWVMFPVGLDSSAFNLPRAITRRNFIRHNIAAPTAALPPAEQENLNAEETLKHLTEALARDLNGRLFPEQAAARFRIFISYSRADSTDVAKSLRDYIQGETQCQVFLDENDIAYGQAFDESLEANVSDHSRAMIVINGDNYADRPWCRWEIGRFTAPRVVPLDVGSPARGGSSRKIHLFHPLLVVDGIRGPAMTRVLPELAQAPVVRWEAGRAKLCFSVLMREVLLGLKDVLVARQVLAGDDLRDAVVVNRLPGPIAIEGLLRARTQAKGARPATTVTIHYPGNGLPLIELRLLQRTFEGVRFCAFRDVMRDGVGSVRGRAVMGAKMHRGLERLQTDHRASFPLQGKVFAISTAHSRRELAALGYLPQHQDEALIHLLRPLFRMGADILFGGLPPTAVPRSGTEPSWSATRNITATLVQLLANERREDGDETGDKKSPAVRGPLIFNVPPWPASRTITPRDEAGWINSCRILYVTPEDAGLPPWPGDIPHNTEEPPPGYRRYVSRVLSEMRRRYEGEYRCRLPAEGERVIRPSAFIFIGGKLEDFSGVLPGIMEEFLHASRTQRPIYLIGGLRGAAGAIARALCAAEGAPRPPEFTIEHYLAQKSPRALTDYPALLAEIEAAGDPHPGALLEELWEVIEKHRGSGLARLFRNGLTDAQNRDLLETANTYDAVRLVWEGISNASGLLNATASPASAVKAGKPTSRRPPRGGKKR